MKLLFLILDTYIILFYGQEIGISAEENNLFILKSLNNLSKHVLLSFSLKTLSIEGDLELI